MVAHLAAAGSMAAEEASLEAAVVEAAQEETWVGMAVAPAQVAEAVGWEAATAGRLAAGVASLAAELLVAGGREAVAVAADQEEAAQDWAWESMAEELGPEGSEAREEAGRLEADEVARWAAAAGGARVEVTRQLSRCISDHERHR